jgi:molecular chaperone DnaJ
MQRDLYEVLGVDRQADGDAIKKAYRKLAMQFHPDKNPGNKEAEDKFKEAATAYEVLSDSEKRARYDRFGHAGVGGGGGPGAQGFSDVSDIFEAFGDIFGDFFGGGGPTRGRRRNQPRRGADLRYYLDMDLKDVLNGLQKDIDYDIEAGCGACDGSGAKKGTKPTVCGQCGGAGQIIRAQGFFQMATTCPACGGRGQTIKDPCAPCHGTGRERKKKKLRVNIPAGVEMGTQLRLSEEGEGGFLGGPPGDLYVEVRVKDNPRFARDGQSLFSRVDISYIQALLGGEIEVATLEGEEMLQVPRGVQNGEVIKLSGQGLPSLRSKKRGDLVFEVRVVFPDKISKKEEELLREIAKVRGDKIDPSSSGWFG